MLVKYLKIHSEVAIDFQRVVAGPDGSFVSTGGCNLQVTTRFKSRTGRIFVIVVVHICIYGQFHVKGTQNFS